MILEDTSVFNDTDGSRSLKNSWFGPSEIKLILFHPIHQILCFPGSFFTFNSKCTLLHTWLSTDTPFSLPDLPQYISLIQIQENVIASKLRLICAGHAFLCQVIVKVLQTLQTFCQVLGVDLRVEGPDVLLAEAMGAENMEPGGDVII